MSKNDLLTEKYQINSAENWRTGSIERARGGCGYDVMAKVEGSSEKWRSVSGWGQDGWDLGDWPYVVIYARRVPEGVDIAYWCEGDVTLYRYPTTEEAFAAVDALAFFHWKHHGASWVDGIETVDDMPEHLCGPYGRDRAREVTA